MAINKGFIVSLALVTLAAPLLAGATAPEAVTSPFTYDFSVPGVLEESRSMAESTSPYFWLNSGAKLVIKDGWGSTIDSSLEKDDLWRAIYLKKNPTDTDGGFFPQNTFRLITRSEWNDFSQEVYFKITDINLSPSYNRDSYSGIFLLSNYKDDNNYYYAGLRMDGQAVIKKRANGVFYTLASVPVFGKPTAYNKKTNPNLIPQNKVLGIRLSSRSLQNANELILYVDTGSGFVSALNILDKSPLNGISYAGVESDFMDTEFDSYSLSK